MLYFIYQFGRWKEISAYAYRQFVEFGEMGFINVRLARVASGRPESVGAAAPAKSGGH